jgi:mannan endo-1,4-beta-mannosidase
VVQAWDDLVALCRRVGLRLLLTPFDTFFTWNHWDRHPYNRANGGPCDSRERLLTCPTTRGFIKRRLAFATERWGGGGVVFAWDIWNEMHPCQGENVYTCFPDFIGDVAPFLRGLETRLHGRAHLQTTSSSGRSWCGSPGSTSRSSATRSSTSPAAISTRRDDRPPRRHGGAAVSAGRLVREALAEIADARPFFDSEHGPIHTFKDHDRTLEEAFDDEYFRHIQWAHLASAPPAAGCAGRTATRTSSRPGCAGRRRGWPTSCR